MMKFKFFLTVLFLITVISCVNAACEGGFGTSVVIQNDLTILNIGENPNGIASTGTHEICYTVAAGRYQVFMIVASKYHPSRWTISGGSRSYSTTQQAWDPSKTITAGEWTFTSPTLVHFKCEPVEGGSRQLISAGYFRRLGPPTQLTGTLSLTSTDPINPLRMLAGMSYTVDASGLSYLGNVPTSVTFTPTDGGSGVVGDGFPVTPSNWVYSSSVVGLHRWEGCPGASGDGCILSPSMAVMDDPSSITLSTPAGILPSPAMINGYPVYDFTADSNAYFSSDLSPTTFSANNFYPDSQLIIRVYETGDPSIFADYDALDFGLAAGDPGGGTTPVTVPPSVVDMGSVLLHNKRNTIEFRVASPGEPGTSGADVSQWGISEPIATIDGILINLVARGALSFDEWRELHFTSAELADPNISGPDANPDADTLSNLLEYLFIADPKVISQGVDLQPIVLTNPEQLRFTYIRRKAAGGIQIIPEFSDDLVTYIGGYEQVSVEDLGDRELVTVQDLVSGASRRFGRLRVLQATQFLQSTTTEIQTDLSYGSDYERPIFLMNTGNVPLGYTITSSDSNLFTPVSGMLSPGETMDVFLPINGKDLGFGTVNGTIEITENTPGASPIAFNYEITVPEDGDNDGLPDQWELDNFGTLAWGPQDDPDNDGLVTDQEINVTNTNPAKWDTDGDLMPDGFEAASIYLNPLVMDDVHGDPDGDGLNNLDEFIYNANPDLPDTDGDGTGDTDEVQIGSLPNDRSDNGQPPAPELAAEIICEVGDPSGSHSEKWKMIIQEDGGANKWTVVADTFGELSGKKSFKQVRKGKKYVITVEHIATNQGDIDGDGKDDPDYDHWATVEAGNAGGREAISIGIVDDNSLLNDPLGIPELDYHEGGDNNLAEGKTATVIIPKIGIYNITGPKQRKTVGIGEGIIFSVDPRDIHPKWSLDDSEPIGVFKSNTDLYSVDFNAKKFSENKAGNVILDYDGNGHLEIELNVKIPTGTKFTKSNGVHPTVAGWTPGDDGIGNGEKWKMEVVGEVADLQFHNLQYREYLPVSPISVTWPNGQVVNINPKITNFLPAPIFNIEDKVFIGGPYPIAWLGTDPAGNPNHFDMTLNIQVQYQTESGSWKTIGTNVHTFSFVIAGQCIVKSQGSADAGTINSQARGPWRIP